MSNKQKLGQFYTTNYNYILEGHKKPSIHDIIIEPFAGNADLLKWIPHIPQKSIETYDIDPQNEYTTRQDTLQNPPTYKNKFILTNPPYLARNKNKDKILYDKYKVNDLYKCFIKNIIHNYPNKGLIIIPLNFFSSIRKEDIKLRHEFFQKFSIHRVNIFEEKVFKDTSYTICSFSFSLRTQEHNINEIKLSCVIYPQKIKKQWLVTSQNNWLIGGELYNLETKHNISRSVGKMSNTKIKLWALDSGSWDGRIRLEYGEGYKGKISDRSFAGINIDKKLNENEQKQLCDDFNKYIEEKRDIYHSLFLNNYRESKKYARKRISFRLAYNIIDLLLI